MRKLLIAVFLIGIILSGCRKDVGVAGPAGPQGVPGVTNDTGTISGVVTMYNEFSLPLLNDSGAIVSLVEGSQTIIDTTDSAGSYAFHGVPTGTYDLNYSRQGYGTMKIYGESFFAGGDVPTSIENIYLEQIPRSTAPDSLSISAGMIDIRLDTLSTSYGQMPENFIVYVGKSRSVGPSNYATYVNIYFEPDGSGGYSTYLGYAANLSNIFNPGDSLFAVGYTYNLYVHLSADPASKFQELGVGSNYVDPASDLLVYPNLSAPSPLVATVY